MENNSPLKNDQKDASLVCKLVGQDLNHAETFPGFGSPRGSSPP
jgi:hypothetical protein